MREPASASTVAGCFLTLLGFLQMNSLRICIVVYISDQAVLGDFSSLSADRTPPPLSTVMDLTTGFFSRNCRCPAFAFKQREIQTGVQVQPERTKMVFGLKIWIEDMIKKGIGIGIKYILLLIFIFLSLYLNIG